MADTKISALTSATTPLAGTELVPLVQSATTKKVTVDNLTAGRAISAASLTVTGDVTVDTNTLKVDSTNNRVGVGTASPATTLEVQASASPIIRVGDGVRHVQLRGGSTTQGPSVGTWYGGDFDIYTNSALVGRWSTTGNLTNYSGNIVIGTSGKGIDFSAAGGTVLDDYEEGSWTPVVTGSTSAGTGTYTIQRATYTKIGNIVAFTIHIVWSAHTGTGTIRVSLPFTAATPAAGGVYYPFSVVGNTLTAPASTTIAAMGFSTLSYMNIYSVSLTPVNPSALAMDTSAGFYINGTYEV